MPSGTPFSPNQDSTPQLCLREQAETLASPVGRSGRGARRRRAARVAHVCLHMGVGVMLRASRQSGQDHQEPLCELIPYISEFDRATELKKSERSGKFCKALGAGYPTLPTGVAKSSDIKRHTNPLHSFHSTNIQPRTKQSGLAHVV